MHRLLITIAFAVAVFAEAYEWLVVAPSNADWTDFPILIVLTVALWSLLMFGLRIKPLRERK